MKNVVILAGILFSSAAWADDASGPGRTTLFERSFGSVYYVESETSLVNERGEFPKTYTFDTDKAETTVERTSGSETTINYPDSAVTVSSDGRETIVRMKDDQFRFVEGQERFVAELPDDRIVYERQGDNILVRGRHGSVRVENGDRKRVIESKFGRTVLELRGGEVSGQSGDGMEVHPYLNQGMFFEQHGVGVFVDFTRMFPFTPYRSTSEVDDVVYAGFASANWVYANGPYVEYAAVPAYAPVVAFSAGWGIVRFGWFRPWSHRLAYGYQSFVPCGIPFRPLAWRTWLGRTYVPSRYVRRRFRGRGVVRAPARPVRWARRGVRSRPLYTRRYAGRNGRGGQVSRRAAQRDGWRRRKSSRWQGRSGRNGPGRPTYNRGAVRPASKMNGRWSKTRKRFSDQGRRSAAFPRNARFSPGRRPTKGGKSAPNRRRSFSTKPRQARPGFTAPLSQRRRSSPNVSSQKRNGRTRANVSPQKRNSRTRATVLPKRGPARRVVNKSRGKSSFKRPTRAPARQPTRMTRPQRSSFRRTPSIKQSRPSRSFSRGASRGALRGGSRGRGRGRAR